ncbi:MAG: RnfABCDGE type electron transport complex subunit A [Planctomycetes bacterium]|nr:RnfABCDGE type electron transport complex subunit A [Planctomycetota bacterium]
MQYVKLVIAAVFVSNFVLAQFLGLCPFIGVSKKTSSAVGMGIAVIFVMTLASFVTYLVYWKLLYMPLGIGVDARDYLNIVVFIVVIASLVQFVEMVLQKSMPALYRALGIYLPLITTNCAVLGVAQLNISRFGSGGFAAGLLGATLNGFASGLGFTLALLLMSAIRERLDEADVPLPFRGVPIAFVVASALALAFLGFSGMA